MKKFFLLVGLIIISCAENKEKKERESFENVLNREINSGIRNDAIFLGYTFGMTEEQFKEKTIQLKEEGKLFVNESKLYAYEILTEDGVTESVFFPEYHNQKLYKLILSVVSKEYLDSEFVKTGLVNLFQKKYGTDYSLTDGSIANSLKYVWIDGNRQIEIYSEDEYALIVYTDLLAEKELKENQKQENKEKMADTVKDL